MLLLAFSACTSTTIGRLARGWWPQGIRTGISYRNLHTIRSRRTASTAGVTRANVILAGRSREVAANIAASFWVVIMVAVIRTVDIWPEAVSVRDAAACSARAASACSPLARA